MNSDQYVKFFVKVIETIPDECFPIKDKSTLQLLCAMQSLKLIISALELKKKKGGK